jgi:hypothetical protein
MQTLYALDLTEIKGVDNIWRPRRSATHRTENRLELPHDGFASPLGFWFATAESWGTVATPLRVEVFDPGEQDAPDYNSRDRSCSFAVACHSYRAQLRLKAKQTQSAGSSTSLFLEIDRSTARIGIARDSWSSVSETILIIVAQFWRFVAIDDLLDELVDWARSDLAKDGFISLIRRHRSRELHSHRRKLQTLILDLPDYEVLLTNPRAGLAPGRPIRLYRTLAGQLSLDRHRRAIDERIEVIEAVLDSLADSLNHLQALAFQIALELAIVALLLLDVGLYLWDWVTR